MPPHLSVFRNENKTSKPPGTSYFATFPDSGTHAQASRFPKPLPHYFPAYGVFIRRRAISACDWSPPPADATGGEQRGQHREYARGQGGPRSGEDGKDDQDQHGRREEASRAFLTFSDAEWMPYLPAAPAVGPQRLRIT